VIAATIILVAAVPMAFSQKAGQERTFASAGEASRALYQATKNDDEQALTQMLGADKDLVSSGNEAEDRSERERFTQKYQEMHRLVRESNRSTVLYIGAENWPFPVPLTSTTGRWYFDSEAGREEIAFRAIGGDEASAIEICRSLVGAEKSNETPAGGNVAKTVQMIKGSGGTKVAGPFDGYYFRTLNGDNSADSQVVADAIYVAYPADYRSSGVMTFVVTPKGVVYERDLGPDTAKQAGSMTNWKPANTWHKSQESEMNP